jgi:hypothetical protein
MGYRTQDRYLPHQCKVCRHGIDMRAGGGRTGDDAGAGREDTSTVLIFSNGGAWQCEK